MIFASNVGEDGVADVHKKSEGVEALGRKWN
jgi:hypothetical protein